uniref:Uncharacterized protein n=1 Tax=Timema tahoe TaxID=61484 RepID=A0A7R9IU78_9NEOP|nr:unnamed protein product [Timema tahoe]
MQRLAQPGDNISVTSSDANSNDGIQITQRERHEMSQLNIATHTYS